MPAVGSSVEILGSWAHVGRSLLVSDLRWRGKPCAPGYDSHYVRVSFRRGDFHPLPQWCSWAASADERVLWNKERMLPAYVITLHVRSVWWWSTASYVAAAILCFATMLMSPTTLPAFVGEAVCLVVAAQ